MTKRDVELIASVCYDNYIEVNTQYGIVEQQGKLYLFNLEKKAIEYEICNHDKYKKRHYQIQSITYLVNSTKSKETLVVTPYWSKLIRGKCSSIHIIGTKYIIIEGDWNYSKLLDYSYVELYILERENGNEVYSGGLISMVQTTKNKKEATWVDLSNPNSKHCKKRVTYIENNKIITNIVENNMMAENNFKQSLEISRYFEMIGVK